MIINSIDLMNGKAVQLKQGKEKKLEVADPKALARKFDKYGPISLIDLDAAFTQGDNEELIRELCALTNCRVGGGIRSIEKAKRIYQAGAEKIIIGTKAFKENGINKEFLKELVENIGKDKIIIAIDSRDGNIVTNGWVDITNIPVCSIVKDLEPYCNEFLLTIVEKEGCLEGTDWTLLNEVKAITKNLITVAGGITDLEDITKSRELMVNTQIGMAVYSGILDLDKAFVETVNWGKDELIPIIVQDESSQVLMLAYSNRESLGKTLETGKMTYFSRSRNQLWLKGETSGNFQTLKKLRLDCDQDTILAQVSQQGNACHLEQYSCFSNSEFSLESLQDIISTRINSPGANSYTASLTDDLLREKIREEAEEVCVAVDYDNKVWEAADLLYFLTVYLVKEKISLDQVFNELQRRRRK